MKKQLLKYNGEELVNFLYEAGTLRKIARAHRQGLLTDDFSDNIASHSFRVTLIGWYIARIEGVDPYKVLTMCLLHDVAEARSNDHNWIHKKYIKVFEEEITQDQFAKDPEARLILSEYKERKSKEAKIAKDADLLDQLFLCAEYAWSGNKEAAIWLESKLKDTKNNNWFFSKTAQNIAQRIDTQKPSDWWKDIWTSKNR